MKNPFKVRHVNPALLFIQFLIILIYGIIAITNSYLAYGLTRYILSSVLFITGIARAADEYSKSKNILKTGITFTIFYTIALALFLPYLVVISVSVFFGVWFLITGIAQVTIIIQCVVQNLKGKVLHSIFALVSLYFSFSLLFFGSDNVEVSFGLIGVYLIIYSLSYFVNAISEILLHGMIGAKVKSKVRISLPVFLTALLPGKLIDDFNAYFKLNEHQAKKLLKKKEIPTDKDCPLEIYIHLVDKGFHRTGHVDLRYKNTAYSFGCYDHHSHFLGGLLSDGLLLMCDDDKYIDFCLKVEKKIVVGFGIALTDEQKEKIEENLAKISSNLVEWKTDYEKGLVEGEEMDVASQFVKVAGAKIWKFSKGTFKKYFAINTNCVKLADKVIGVSGLGIVSVNGIVVPGAYYSMLNELYENGDDVVIERNIYKDVDIDDEK